MPGSIDGFQLAAKIQKARFSPALEDIARNRKNKEVLGFIDVLLAMTGNIYATPFV
jgi:hypothetical protein